MTQVSNSVKVSTLIDARGPRFGAAITTVVLAAALATNNVWFIVAQAIVFAVGAFKGPQFTPYAFVYKTLVKPRLKNEFEKNKNFNLEYFEIADEETLSSCIRKVKNKKYRAFIAVFINDVRLIDTISLN